MEFDSIVFDLFHTLVDPQEHAPAGFRRLDVVAGILDLPVTEIDLWWQQNVAEFVSTPVSPIEAIIELARSRRIVLSPTAIAEIDRAMVQPKTPQSQPRFGGYWRHCDRWRRWG